MMRALFTVIAAFCTAALAAQCFALGLLWQKGYLTAESIKEVREILGGQTKSDPAGIAAKDETPVPPSFEELQRIRLKRLLQLDARENELNLLKTTTTATANELISRRLAFDEEKKKFQTELTTLQERLSAESTEQTRAILLAMSPAMAVERLMGLPLDDDIDLVKGMPEKSIAKILQEFRGDAAKVERGQKLFEALKRGNPLASLVNAAIAAPDDGKD